MYAIVRCGGRQEKASVDDVLTVDLLAGEVGSTLTLPALLVVDGDQVVSDPAELDSYEVAAEIVGPAAGPKINMIRYKNKTGYRRRLGHRQKYTQVKITSIGRPSTAKPSTAKPSTAKPSTGKQAQAPKAAAEKASRAAAEKAPRAAAEKAPRAAAEKAPRAAEKAPRAGKASGTSRTSRATKAEAGEKA